ncbi:uncharacterized protein METZ01_LOCUS283537, partial [marine metagenome]
VIQDREPSRVPVAVFIHRSLAEYTLEGHPQPFGGP